jgi:excisionase family DNA binding protein
MADARLVSRAGSLLQLLTVREVARHLRLSERQIRRMIADGRIVVVRFGRAVRIRPEVVAALREGK